ncbi:hypothetical protein KVT40_009224 [Elsinoe batatas]|uniref:Uncharacterized protein n=1 Tax=Elsinoe batatas TaxID=2601811 RepID=A0A8K0PBW6_9PEZI|nr:hypothetical protein KVT40_009224 [Elsinoe batatas]
MMYASLVGPSAATLEATQNSVPAQAYITSFAKVEMLYFSFSGPCSLTISTLVTAALMAPASSSRLRRALLLQSGFDARWIRSGSSWGLIQDWSRDLGIAARASGRSALDITRALYTSFSSSFLSFDILTNRHN